MVQYISDRVLVMYLGRAVEIGPVDSIYEHPAHPYTQALLASRLSMDPRKRRTEPPLTGDPPNPVNPPSGCRFRTRCPLRGGGLRRDACRAWRDARPARTISAACLVVAAGQRPFARAAA